MYDDTDFFGSIILYLLLAIVLVAWIMAVYHLIKAGEAKGHFKNGAGAFWFIGLFASPIVLGLYIVALPDRSALPDMGVAEGSSLIEKVIDAELPPI